MKITKCLAYIWPAEDIQGKDIALANVKFITGPYAIDCFVWLPIAYCDENTQIHRLSENELAIMLRDIPGEGG